MLQGLTLQAGGSNDSIGDLVRREGWGLHQRLQVAARPGAAIQTANRSGSLDHWRGLVAPNMPGNFDNRLEWDGLTSSSAAWALEPPEPATPLKSLLKNEPTSQFSTGISGFPAQKVGSAAIRAANCPISASLASLQDIG